MMDKERNPHKLWYTSPAGGWLQAMPLGDGRLGAMVYGGTARETIQFNEDSVWTRAEEDMNNPDALAYLPKVRELLLEGRILEAQELASISQFAIPNEQPAYQVLGELRLMSMGQFTAGVLRNYPEYVNDFSGGYGSTMKVTDYYRELDMQKAVASVSYRHNHTGYAREYFISEETNTFVGKLTAEAPRGLNLYAQIFREFDAHERPCAKDALMLDGRAGAFGSKYYMEIKFVPVGGTVEAVGQHIVVRNADALYIYASAATDFRFEDYREQARRYIAAAMAVPYEELKARHEACHRELYDRADLVIRGRAADTGLSGKLTLDQRVARLRDSKDTALDDFDLIGQYFSFVRYQMITASRAGSQPTNLQGIWCNEIWPSWECKHTTNINFEMNYWPAEVANLHECHTAMFDLIDRVVENGKKTARIHYGCRGFVVHSNTDLWADTAAVDNVYCGLWPAAGGWLALHLWEAYQYSLDEKFLKERAYPVLREAALFYVDFLVDNGKGQLVFGPSVSPENSYYDKNGYRVGLCMGAAMDHSIIRCAFAAYKAAAEILGCGEDLTAEIDEKLEKLAPLRIAKDGTLLEWMEDYEQMLPGHRHLSHLFCIYPGNEVSVEKTPELAAACRRSLEKRAAYGSGASGWSGAWAANIWTRLYEGDKAYQIIRDIFRINTSSNLFDLHPPLPPGNDKYVFQIDGNFGALSAICQCLLQSFSGEVMLLPALPAAWASGSVKGLRARGGFTVDMEWEDGALTRAAVSSSVGGALRISAPNAVSCGGAAGTMDRGRCRLTVDTQPGKTYTFVRS